MDYQFNTVAHIVASTDGAFVLAAGGGKAQGQVLQFNPAGALLRSIALPDPEERVLALALSPDNATVFVCTAQRLCAYDVASGRVSRPAR